MLASAVRCSEQFVVRVHSWNTQLSVRDVFAFIFLRRRNSFNVHFGDKTYGYHAGVLCLNAMIHSIRRSMSLGWTGRCRARSIRTAISPRNSVCDSGPLKMARIISRRGRRTLSAAKCLTCMCPSRATDGCSTNTTTRQSCRNGG